MPGHPALGRLHLRHKPLQNTFHWLTSFTEVIATQANSWVARPTNASLNIHSYSYQNSISHYVPRWMAHHFALFHNRCVSAPVQLQWAIWVCSMLYVHHASVWHTPRFLAILSLLNHTRSFIETWVQCQDLEFRWFLTCPGLVWHRCLT